MEALDGFKRGRLRSLDGMPMSRHNRVLLAGLCHCCTLSLVNYSNSSLQPSIFPSAPFISRKAFYNGYLENVFFYLIQPVEEINFYFLKLEFIDFVA